MSTTPETPWIADIRKQWAAFNGHGKALKTASFMSSTASADKARAMTWRHAWAMARLWGCNPKYLAYCREQMRVSALECVALARHYVMETARQEQAMRTRSAA